MRFPPDEALGFVLTCRQPERVSGYISSRTRTGFSGRWMLTQAQHDGVFEGHSA